MKIVTFKEHQTLRGQTRSYINFIKFNPGERYIIDDFAASQLMAIKDKLWEQPADLTPYLPVNKPSDWRGAKVLFHRSRGIGDELMMTGVVRYFREVLGAQPYVLCSEMMAPVWGNLFEHADILVSHPAHLPIHLDAVYRTAGPPFFDWCFFWESISEFDSDSEQENVYDRMFRMSGLDWAKVPEKYKRPYLKLGEPDRAEFQQWSDQIQREYVELDLEEGYTIFQASPVNPLRALPESKTLEVLESLLSEGRQVVLLDDRSLPMALEGFVSTHEDCFSLAGCVPSLRILFSLVANAAKVVGPDSMAIHVAEALDVPSLGFYGPVSPESRTKYYRFHEADYHPELCRYSPCFHFDHGFPTHKCPRGKEQKTCEVFEGITLGGREDNHSSPADAILGVASRAPGGK